MTEQTDIAQHADRLRQNLAKCEVPEHCREGFVGYVIEGAPIGSFLTAIFENNLVDAACGADDVNLRSLRAYAMALYYYCPSRGSGCWGSQEDVRGWQALGGLRGLLQREEASMSSAAKGEG